MEAKVEGCGENKCITEIHPDSCRRLKIRRFYPQYRRPLSFLNNTLLLYDEETSKCYLGEVFHMVATEESREFYFDMFTTGWHLQKLFLASVSYPCSVL
jgi:hypothetical protein